ncbi:hypothetical protein [Nocardia sp. alder85J]|uniref:hypothetical protein n=1 Tax=Nocardia sp. alder85J TaxID=2862949 RepID=UPI001CD41D58|nr:hypothetical protein [Nocardia sp. alder85J]MCX4091387.1 hypothetical protein [Nocardia sp. alder85J]
MIPPTSVHGNNSMHHAGGLDVTFDELVTRMRERLASYQRSHHAGTVLGDPATAGTRTTRTCRPH